jgi:OmcA/MtrC family decaheme c-type cytochrome
MRLFDARVLVPLACLFVLAPANAERPAKQNPSFKRDAITTAFDSLTTGVVIKVKSASIAKDGTITARFTLTDSNGAGLDINGVYTAGAATARFVAAYIPNNQSQYVAYTTTVLKSTLNNNPSQTQAAADSGGKTVLVDATTGTYDYTFGTKAPATFDATATHSIGAQASRDLTPFGYPEVFVSDDVFTFVPSGAAVTNVRDVVAEKACNSCHNPLSAHGGGRRKVAFCVMCHTPQSVNPDTLNTVDFKVFIHKIHRGSSLPSVVAGTPYTIFHRGATVDFSAVVFPQDLRNCTTCHTGTTQADNWKTKPTRAACGSCHDNVDFVKGTNHNGIQLADDTQCVTCHAATMTAEFDNSIPGAHVVPSSSATLTGLVTEIQKVENATPGNAPVVTFKVADKAGNPVDISKITTVRVVLGGPNTDYQTGPGAIRVSENPNATKGANGVYTYTMTNKIPAAATGSYTVSLQAANSVTLAAGTPRQTTAVDSSIPKEVYFAVDKSTMAPRRQVVSTAKCTACHANLAFVHGGTRGASQECTICHNPSLTDGTSKQSVNFATQIHSIHRGENLANPYILGTTNYQEVRFPGDLRDCTTCHINQTYLPENIGAKAPVASPGGFTPTTPPLTAACQGCHDDKATASHALSNTNALGESCLTCHGVSGDFSVDKAHARN